MRATPPDVSQVSEKVDALRREFDAFVEHDEKNRRERSTRFEKIEKQIPELAEALKQMQSRLDQLEGRNQI